MAKAIPEKPTTESIVLDVTDADGNEGTIELPNIVTVHGMRTVTVFAEWSVKCSKGTVARIDLSKFDTVEKRTRAFALASRTRLNDRLGEKGLEQSKAQKIVDDTITGWYADPTGRPRGESDPFLNECRRIVASAGAMKGADARVATLEKIKEVVGAAFGTLETMARQRIADAEMFSASIAPAAPASEEAPKE